VYILDPGLTRHGDYPMAKAKKGKKKGGKKKAAKKK
jgi:hypothetical protein